MYSWTICEFPKWIKRFHIKIRFWNVLLCIRTIRSDYAIQQPIHLSIINFIPIVNEIYSWKFSLRSSSSSFFSRFKPIQYQRRTGSALLLLNNSICRNIFVFYIFLNGEIEFQALWIRSNNILFVRRNICVRKINCWKGIYPQFLI